MQALAEIGVFVAGVAAGTVNTVVGSGTLITFPVLLAAGLPSVTANVSNTVGLVPGAVTGAYGYRRELAGRRRLLIRVGTAGLLGGLSGGVLLLASPASVFQAVVPVLIAGALVLVLLQPRLARYVGGVAEPDAQGRERAGALLLGCVYACGVYGGYFGAAQGVLLLGVLGLLLHDSLQRANAVKNLLALAVNGVAAVLFAIRAPVDWRAAGLVALGSVIGGLLGAVVGRRLSEPVLRGVIVVIGLCAIVKVFVG